MYFKPNDRTIGRVGRVLILTLALGASILLGEEPVCARVKMEIEQELTFEREAFEARMTIHNGLVGVTLTDITVDIVFSDEKGKTVLATSATNFEPDSPTAPKFFFRFQDGSLTPDHIPGETSASIKWLIIPSGSAGGEMPQGKLYQVGARLSYRLNGIGDPELVDVSPDFIYVKPQPRLSLEYFLPREVNGDDPFTVPIEEPVPFSLGIRITNTGFGPAKNLRIESGQPRIIENKQGLQVNFVLKGSEVNGAAAQPTLLADFGTVEPKARGIGRWKMECSLYGTFLEFSALFTHADELGGQLTSLIRPPIKARLLLADVLVDLPGRDAIRDFLAYENHTVLETDPLGGLFLYETDREVADAPVSDLSATATLSGTGSIFTLQAPRPSTGLLYVRKIDPKGGTSALQRVVRADGYTLPAANYWLSKTYDKVGKRYTYYINLFDASSPAGQAYSLTFGNGSAVNRPPVFSSLPPRVAPVNTVITTTVQAFDPDGTQTELRLDRPPPGMTLTFMSKVGGYTGYALNWRPTLAGSYAVPVLATDGEFTVSTVANITVTSSPTGLYDAWKKRYGLTDDAADPDRDGMSNLLEYALDADPFTPDRQLHLSFNVVEVAGKDYVAVTFNRRNDDPRLRVLVEGNVLPQASTGWTAQTTEMPVSQVGVPSPLRRVQVRDSLAVDPTRVRRFLRVRATLN